MHIKKLCKKLDNALNAGGEISDASFQMIVVIMWLFNKSLSLEDNHYLILSLEDNDLI